MLTPNEAHKRLAANGQVGIDDSTESGIAIRWWYDHETGVLCRTVWRSASCDTFPEFTRPNNPMQPTRKARAVDGERWAANMKWKNFSVSCLCVILAGLLPTEPILLVKAVSFLFGMSAGLNAALFIMSVIAAQQPHAGDGESTRA